MINNNNNDNDKIIDDIISMLDSFSSNEEGHMNIFINKEIDNKTIEKANSRDCSSTNTACQVPTLFEGVDDLSDS